MLRLRDACFAVMVTGACNPVSDPSNVPDASIDATDMRPPMIESSHPANMATKVSILQPVSVFFDEALDPDSVNEMTVKLGYDQSQPPLFWPNFNVVPPHGPVPAGLTPVKGTVSYDAAARKISFVPALPLPYGYQFTLAMDVKDTAGLAFTGTVKFTTYVNGNTRQLNYNTATGLPNSWVGQPTDTNGRMAKRISIGGPGPDGIWFTMDDPRNQRFDFDNGADGRILRERVLNSGPDGQFDTADDQTVSCVSYVYNAQGLLSRRAYSQVIGADNMWCTDDDGVTYNYVYAYEDAKQIGWSIGTAPGTDGAWHTDDDPCVVFYEYTFDAQGNKTREVYRTCGTDGLPRTADDANLFYYDYEYDANGNVLKAFYKSGPGADSVWLNADDDTTEARRYVRNSDGLVTDVIRTYDAGPDAIWGTADDTGGDRTATAYNAMKLPEEITSYAIGADNMWGTADDVISNYSKLTYDVNGNRIDQKQYVAGPDGLWKTADDRVFIDFDFDLSK